MGDWSGPPHSRPGGGCQWAGDPGAAGTRQSRTPAAAGGGKQQSD